MSSNNSTADQALLNLLERDLSIVGSATRYDLPELEALAQRAAYAGLLDEADADRIGSSLGRLRDALGSVHRCLAWLRNSRPKEVVVIGIDERTGLLAEVPAEVGPDWVDGLMGVFERQHDRQPTQLVTASVETLPDAVRQAAKGRLQVIEDKTVRPGYARLVALS